MATKIEGYTAAAAGGPAGGMRPVETARPGGQGGDSVGSVQRVDSVKLTPDAMQLHQLEKAIASIPVADHERVAKIRQAIQDGSYKIDPKAVASKLARTEWDLARIK